MLDLKIITQLKHIAGKDGVLSTPEDLAVYSYDGTFEEHMMRAAIGPATLLVIAGQYRLTGSTVQLTETGGAPISGIFLGSRLTVGNSPSDASVYQRSCSGAAC